MSKDMTTKPLLITVWLLAIITGIELLEMAVIGFLGVPKGPWIEAGLLSLFSAPFFYLWAIKVVRERLRAERLLRESEERHRRLVEFSPEAIYVHSDGKLVYVNAIGAKLLAAAGSEDMVGKSLFDLVLPYYRDVAEEWMRQAQEEEKPEKDLVAIQMSRLDGQVIDVEWIGMRTTYSGKPAVQIAIRDVTERKRLESQLMYLADHDHLTGLFNRRRFREDLSRQISYALRYGPGGAVLFLDVDNFKYVNDALGHRWGDELLATLARQLQERLRDTDVLARLGGDEFAILLPHADAAQARALAEQILHAMAHNDVVIEGQPIRITTSIGIALFPEHGRNAEELLAHADLAMYEAKEQGRNRICVYSPGQEQSMKMQSNLLWVKRIREALEQDLFVLQL